MNFYDVLSIKTTATDKEIKKAYRLLAKKYHPDTYLGDKRIAEEKMQEINIAYETLSDPDLRKDYNDKLGITEKNVKNAENYKKTYSQKNHYQNRYNKDGVNYEVKYRPNNSKIHYDKYGYAESNYYTSNSEEDQYRKFYNNLEKEKLKQFLKGKNLIYVAIGAVLIISVVGFTIYKAIESINEFITSTQAISSKINSSKEENQKKIKENTTELKESTNKELNNMEEVIRQKEQELMETYNNIKENYDAKEILNELGVTDSDDQQEVLDFINRLKNEN